jgi:cathepsin B
MNKNILFAILFLIASITSNPSSIISEGFFKGKSINEIKSRLGFKNFLPYRNDIPRGEINEDLPTNFDSREKWGNCIHPIRDQGHCGSCWAFGATEVLSDRFCINNQDVILSPQDLVSCNTQNHGCNGGNLPLTWTFLASSGAVSDECFPYTSGNGVVEPCRTSCVDSSIPFKKYKSTSVTQPKTIEAIKAQIYHNGPVEVGFQVYRDFLSYTSGIYIHKSGELLGGHAVKIIGWGNENNVVYWIAANSWGPEWGEEGFFRIYVNQCGISSQAIAGLPKLN